MLKEAIEGGIRIHLLHKGSRRNSMGIRADT